MPCPPPPTHSPAAPIKSDVRTAAKGDRVCLRACGRLAVTVQHLELNVRGMLPSVSGCLAPQAGAAPRLRLSTERLLLRRCAALDSATPSPVHLHRRSPDKGGSRRLSGDGAPTAFPDRLPRASIRQRSVASASVPVAALPDYCAPLADDSPRAFARLSAPQPSGCFLASSQSGSGSLVASLVLISFRGACRILS